MVIFEWFHGVSCRFRSSALGRIFERSLGLAIIKANDHFSSMHVMFECFSFNGLVLFHFQFEQCIVSNICYGLKSCLSLKCMCKWFHFDAFYSI